VGDAVIAEEYSVAMDGDTARVLREHLIRADGQEDLCFALYRPATGRRRRTAVMYRVLLPQPGERRVHGNASFEPAYFERVLSAAVADKAGIVFLHSHPFPGWQHMSDDDVRAEEGHAAAALGSTRLPLVGMTTGSDSTWSARFWERIGPGLYRRCWCRNVRTVGTRLKVDFSDHLCPPPAPSVELERTIHAWGEQVQANLARIRVGIIGAGSVGAFVGEAMARTGLQDLVTVDFDIVKIHNLDRLLHATRADAQAKRLKIDVLAQALRAHSTAAAFAIEPIPHGLHHTPGYEAALDCDVLFSCVDRPLPRHIMNLIAQGGFIPVIDGGILVRRNARAGLVGADWRAHTTGPGRRCLACIGQYDPGEVSLDRQGLLDDPRYVESLPDDHPLLARENVFAFAQACSSLLVLQFLQSVIAPVNCPSPGRQLYHFVPGALDTEVHPSACDASCLVPRFHAAGDAMRELLDLQAPPAAAHSGSEKVSWLRRLAEFFKGRMD
jgi:hypothetical protein